jgi:hypothetical protein
MLDAWNRAQHYRDLAEGRLAMISFSTQMRNLHSVRRTSRGRVNRFDSSDLTDGISRAAPHRTPDRP